MNLNPNNLFWLALYNKLHLGEVLNPL